MRGSAHATALRTSVLAGLAIGALTSLPRSQAAVPPPEVRQCLGQRLHGQEPAAQKCFTGLARANLPYLRAEGAWGLADYDTANTEFRAAVAQADGNALYRTRWGELLHERFNNVDAVALFKEALQRDPKDAQAMLGLARVSADGFDNEAVSWAGKALAADPKLAAAHELLANLALEDNQPDLAVKEADTALGLDPESLDAMAMHAVIEILADRSPDQWWARLHAINPVYGPGFAIAAQQLVLNRRYQDGGSDVPEGPGGLAHVMVCTL
ncbi:MAG: hypothetical protein WDM77_05195 [Steroidobacteraceae bacterium]